MAGTVVTKTVTKTHTIKYCFCCEKCDMQTPWYEISIVRAMDSSAYQQKNLKSEAKLEKALDRQITEHIQWLYQEVENGKFPKSYSLKKDESDGGAGDRLVSGEGHETLFAQQKCPHCGQVQS